MEKENSYPFKSILLNGRTVTLENILAGRVDPLSLFEKTTLSFIKYWLEGENNFTIYTSGSTGAPKAINITRDQMVSSARATGQALKLRHGDNALICVDTKYIAGQMMLVRCFVSNMKIIAIDPVSNPIAHIKEVESIDFVALVPLQLSTILNSSKAQAINTIKKIIVGGAPLALELEERLQGYKAECYATFGMTETISHIALRKINGKERSPTFQTLPDVKIAADERGCLMIKAPYLTSTLVTNDIVEIYNDSTFKWIGRIDNVINSGGVKINAEVLEEQITPLLRKFNIHQRFFITGLPDKELGQKVVIVIEAYEASTVGNNLLTSTFKENLSKYQIPKDIIGVSTFILTENGKIDRSATKKFLTDSNKKFTLKK